MISNEIKILIPTPVYPTERSLRIDYVSLIEKKLKEKTAAEIVWLVYQPWTIELDKKSKNIFDIHDYDNAIKVIEDIKPNCIMVNQSLEPVQLSLSLAAKFLNTKLVSFYLDDYKTRSSQKLSRFRDFRRILNMIYYDKIVFKKKKNPFQRVRFHLYKKRFLQKTKHDIKQHQKNTQLKLNFSTVNQLQINTLPNLHLLCTDSWIEPLKKLGIPDTSLVITGNPIWDVSFLNTKKRQKSLKDPGLQNIRILIITDSLLEHGHWTPSQRNKFLNSLFTTLKKSNFDFSIKIHPSSEVLDYYESLLKKLELDKKIFQKENIWDLINDYDLVVSYGYTTAHTELACGEIKMVLLEMDRPAMRLELVDAGIKTGLIQVCTNFADLPNVVSSLHERKVVINEEFNKERSQLIKKFGGKSDDLIATSIINICKD